MSPALAQDPLGLEGYAQAVAEMTARRWAGPRVPFPVLEGRPAATAARVCAAHVCLLGPGSPGTKADAELWSSALAGAEGMATELLRRGFEPQPPDGRLGDGPELDVYFDDAAAPFRVAFDDAVFGAALDTGLVHVRLAPSVGSARIAACAAQAVAEARLAALDPAEAPAVRTALGALLAAPLDGADGCVDVFASARADDAVDANAGNLALLVARLGLVDERFLVHAYDVARQHTWEGSGLRASPDFLEVLMSSADLGPRGARAMATDFGVAAVDPPLDDRWPEDFDRRTSRPDFELAFEDLPARTAPREPPLGVFGSSRTTVDVAGAAPDARLRVFLRGEAGTTWSLVALGIDAAGRLARRVEAPVVAREPRAYLTVELRGLATVDIVVTHVGTERPDADTPDRQRRTFHLVVDAASDAP